jgi:hypothetical protein
MFSFAIKLKDGRLVQLDVPTQSAATLVQVLGDQGVEFSVRESKWLSGSFKWPPEADAMLRKLIRGKRKRSAGTRFGPVN